MLYIIIPAIAWLLSIVFLRLAQGKKGFDFFFLNFSLIGLEGIACYAFYKFFPIHGGHKAFLYFVGAHSALLLLYAIVVAGKKLLRMAFGKRQVLQGQ